MAKTSTQLQFLPASKIAILRLSVCHDPDGQAALGDFHGLSLVLGPLVISQTSVKS